MTFEIGALLASIFLGLVHIGAASFTFKAQVGNRYTVGSRDEGLQPVAIAARLHRANANFLETFPYFAASIFALQSVNAFGTLSTVGCAMYLIGRTLYLPLYAAGVPWLRTISWNVATLGLAFVAVACVL